MEPTDSVGTCIDMEEAFSSQRLSVSRRKRDTLSALPRLRPGIPRQYHSVSGFAPTGVPTFSGVWVSRHIRNKRYLLTSYSSRGTQLFDVAKGLEYLHDLDILHGNLKGVGQFFDPLAAFQLACLPLPRSCNRIDLWLQANIVVDGRGRARLTEYRLAPINSDLSFTVAATPGAVGTSRWLAPEIITPTRKGAAMPVMESKPADIFAFGMLAIEVFTGKIPFEEQKNEAVVLRISQGGRPAMPVNSREVGLTDDIWGILESCWQQTAKKRPGVGEVARRWQRSVASTNNDGFIPPCVRITLTIVALCLVPCSNFRD